MRHLADAIRDAPLDRYDAVLVRVLSGDRLHAQHAAAILVEHLNHPLQTGDLGIDQVIGEVHHERLFTDDRLRA